MPDLRLQFSEPPIVFSEIKEEYCKKPECFKFPESERIRLGYVQKGDIDLRNADNRYRGGNAFFNQKLIYDDAVAGTVTGQEKQFVFSEKRRLSYQEVRNIGSYPQDYNFLDIQQNYLIGMSVPPVMTAQVAHQIFLQWFSKDE